MTERNDQQEIRRRRRQELLDQGFEVYPARSQPTVALGDLRRQWKLDQPVTVVGRIRAIRSQGGSAFLDLDDGTGPIQIFFQKKALAEDFDFFTKNLDLGDFLEVEGVTFLTKAGEQSVNAGRVRWLGKALRPLPSRWHGLENVEQRYRHRELDLLINEESKMSFAARSKIIQTLRRFLERSGFMEVETPVLQPIPGGTLAKPFVTHHNALDVDLYLRIAPELYLKRLIVGGFGGVYELARCFRNEGIDYSHNPEFTILELYVAYKDYRWMMEYTENLLRHVSQAVHGKTSFTYAGREINLGAPFERMTYRDMLIKYVEIDIDQHPKRESLLAATRRIGTEVPDSAHRGAILDALMKQHVRAKIIEPTFVIDYPIELSPLAKKKFNDPRYAERFQLLIGGLELVNVFSELNDPVDQRQRFESQQRLREAGDEEAHRLDENFLEALEYGMPPTAGFGMGVDRLVALLLNKSSLKEVILFPTLKPEQS